MDEWLNRRKEEMHHANPSFVAKENVMLNIFEYSWTFEQSPN